MDYHHNKIKLVPRMKKQEPHTMGTFLPAPNALPPPPPLWTKGPTVKIATMEDLIREGFIKQIFLSYANGRVEASANVADYGLYADGTTACEAIRKLSQVVLDKAFEL